MGPSGGGKHGPSLAGVSICHQLSLSALFIFFFPIEFLELIARKTNRYGNEDWVRPVSKRTYTEDDDESNGGGDSDDDDNGDENKPKLSYFMRYVLLAIRMLGTASNEPQKNGET